MNYKKPVEHLIEYAKLEEIIKILSVLCTQAQINV